MYSAQRREVWQVGDVGYWWPGLPRGAGQPRRRVDQIAAEFRAAVLAAHAALGPVDLNADDPGRAAIMPLLVAQAVFRNQPDSPYGFAAVDGTPVPGR